MRSFSLFCSLLLLLLTSCKPRINHSITVADLEQSMGFLASDSMKEDTQVVRKTGSSVNIWHEVLKKVAYLPFMKLTFRILNWYSALSFPRAIYFYTEMTVFFRELIFILKPILQAVNYRHR